MDSTLVEQIVASFGSSHCSFCFSYRSSFDLSADALSSASIFSCCTVTLRPEWEAKDASGENQVYADAFVSATKAFFKTEEDRKLARKYLGRKEY